MSDSLLIQEITDLRERQKELEHRLACQAPVINWLRCGLEDENDVDESYWQIATERIAKMDAGIDPGWKNEITDLRARLAASEAEKKEYADSFTKSQALLASEIRKREEAERLLADVRSWVIRLADTIANVPGVFPVLNPLMDLVRKIPIPTPEKKSQEKA